MKDKKETKVTLGNLYEINKNLIEKQVPVLTQNQIQEKNKLVKDFVQEKNNEYYMLLCNEKKDYTLFHRNKKFDDFLDKDENYIGDRVEDVLINECLINRGKIKSIERTNDNQAIEIWLSIDKESYCYYFFPYDGGVIEC